MRPALLLASFAFAALSTTTNADEGLETATAPHFLVDADIQSRGNTELLVAARLYFDQFEQAFHFDGQRDRPDLANRTQKLSILQSEIVRFSLSQVSFTTVQGQALSVEEAKQALKGRPAVLFLPRGATLHPAIRALLKPDAVIVSSPRGSRPENQTIPRPVSR